MHAANAAANANMHGGMDASAVKITGSVISGLFGSPLEMIESFLSAYCKVMPQILMAF